MVELPNGILLVCVYLVHNVPQYEATSFILRSVTHEQRLSQTVMMGDFNQNARTNDTFMDQLNTDLRLDLITLRSAVMTSRAICIDLVLQNDN